MQRVVLPNSLSKDMSWAFDYVKDFPEYSLISSGFVADDLYNND